MQSSRLLSLSPSSPSFNSYSSVNLVEIATRVVEELRIQDDSHKSELDDWAQEDQNNGVVDDDEEEDDFDFAFVCREPDSSPVSADEIFYNGQIKPTYPYTDFLPNDSRDQVLINGNSVANNTTTTSKTTSSPPRSPLRKLFSEESSSCSSSEADELDAVAPGTYCVWNPKRTNGDRHQESSPGGRCKKSNSAGSSKRWRLRDILHRSNSDGKDTFVFLAPSKKSAEGVNVVGVEEQKKEEAVAEKGEKSVVKEHNHYYYVRNSRGGRSGKEGDDNKRRSYLPYRQDLMGVFSNVNGLSRSLRPF